MEVIADFSEADLCVINTCTVTEEADQDALRLIRKIGRRNPTAKVVVTGCLASRDPQTILREMPQAIVVGNADKMSIPALIGCSSTPALSSVTGLWGRSRAFVKIQDGCDMVCAFCIIPSIRPTLSSKPYVELEAEIRGLVENKCPEIVLCGIRLGRYLSKDASGRRVDFVGMLERLLDIPGDFRIRLSSLEITDVTDRFISFFSSAGEKLAPSLHLPLQSGSDAILKSMGRWYSAVFYRRRLEALRAKIPDCAIFSDVMAGFPGESATDFQESFDFIRAMNFSGLHPFRYSLRPGTLAETRTDHLSDAVILERAEVFRSLDHALREKFALRAVGSARRVVIEGRPGKPEGLCEDFLTVELDCDPRSRSKSGPERLQDGRYDPAARYPGSGFAWVRVVSANGITAKAEVLSHPAFSKKEEVAAFVLR
jgi:threonylcarbamoyladenosine tRNA methylthiotransferase MtaB